MNVAAGKTSVQHRSGFAHAVVVLALAVAPLWNVGCARDESVAELPSGKEQAAPAEERQVASVESSANLPAIGQLEQAVAKQLEQREALDETLWRQEVRAGRHGRVFVDLWDRLRESKDAYAVVRDFALPKLTLPEASETEQLDLGVEYFACEQPAAALDAEQWQTMLSNWQEAGYELEQSEWHHRRFDVDDQGQAQSTMEMELHVRNAELDERLIVRADLHVKWQSSEEGESPKIASIEVPELQIWKRRGKPPFRLAATLPLDERSVENVADFLGLYDLDGDGDAEIIFGDRLYRNAGGGKFATEPLAQHRVTPLNAAVIADFNGDGKADVFCADPGRSPQLLAAGADGRFHDRPSSVDIPPLELPQAVTAGDVNGDGNLDVWLTQYKGAYDEGQMPTPYYDANDGYPSYLLLGDGRGQFRDATEEAGLAAKRFRRTYSTSLVDLDADHDLDLLVVSDFAGVDVYENDGSGVFRDVNEEWLDVRNNFGMSHVLDDFDADGRLDFYVTGMASTTARRLEAMGIRHPQFDQHNKMRPVMGYGNRMYLASGERFQQPPNRDDVARTGWSWGASSLDFDNDGDSDLFVGNGHISGKSAQDYCSVFWRHDIYTGSHQPNPVLNKLFLDVQRNFELGQGGSWNGFEHNSLLVKQGDEYVNLGYLMGVASEFDTRGVVSNDIDSDGLMDLLVLQFARGRPSVLHVFRNNLTLSNHWVGVRLADEPGRAVLGATVTLVTDVGRRTKHIVTGDSFVSQHAAAAHFGLGDREDVRQIEVRWQDGTKRVVENPAVDQYHQVRASE